MRDAEGTQEAQEAQASVYRRLSPMQRLENAFQLYTLAKEMIRTREKRLHPDLSPEELELRVRSFFR